MSTAEKAAMAFLAGLTALGLLGTLLSPKSQTPGVLQSAGGSLAQTLTAAQGATGTGGTPGGG